MPEETRPSDGDRLSADEIAALITSEKRFRELAEWLPVMVTRGGAVPDLVVLDLTMPGLNGAETFELLREIDADLRILLGSGYTLDGDTARLLDAGRASFLQKPFDVGVLSNRLRELLDHE